KGSYYKVRGSIRFATVTNTGFASYMIRNFTDSVNVGVAATINSYSYWEGQQEAIAYIDAAQKDINVGIYITGVNSATGAEITDGFTFLDIQEVNRTTIIDPCEDGKNINFEYGDFRLSADQRSNLVAGGIIAFDTVYSGNMALLNNKVLLKAGKTYEISAEVCGECSNSLSYGIYNESDSNWINLGFGVGVVSGGAYISNQNSNAIFKATEDTYISIKINTLSGAAVLFSATTHLIIKEIAQPYYFNYYKDSIASNVLFSGNAASVGDYTLSDDITKYKYLLISWQTGNSASGTTAITQTKTDMIPVDTIAIGDTNNKRLWFDMLNDTTLKSVLLLFFKSSKIMTYGFGTASSPWTNPVVTRIEGIGYTYENPYQDVITTVDEFVLTDSAVDTDINSLWSEVGI
ncbi:hypothetical protein, partial [Clostridium beijerinckii]